MPADVFLSYARDPDAVHAAAVREALVARGVSVFLDRTDIATGERFTATLVDALLGARVVVVFADEAYFGRWYCLWEWRLARMPFLAAFNRGASDAEQRAALLGVVLAIPPKERPTALDRFPPTLREHNWPHAADAAAVVEMVVRQLALVPDTLADRLDALEPDGAATRRAEMLGAARLPAPHGLQGIDRAPLALPGSIGEHFVGRADDLWRIDDLLVTSIGGTPGAAALTGAISAMGGVGKTRLALEYLHRFGRTRFPGGLFWIDADLSDTLVEARQHEILQTLDASAPAIQVYRDPASGRDLVRDLVRAVERRASAQPVLVIVDNLPEPDLRLDAPPPPPLTRWWPALGSTATLVTARFDVSVAEGHAVAPLALRVLDEASAVRMLVDGCDERGRLTEGEWREVAEWVGRLPLVLSVLNGAQRGGGLDPHRLLAHARAGDGALDEADEAFGTLASYAHDASTRAVYRHASRALALSYELLTPEVQAAARLLATLAPAPIPLELVDALADRFPPAVRAALITRSFVTRLPGADGPLMFGVMHRVLAEFLRQCPDGDVPDDVLASEARDALLAVMTAEGCRAPAMWPLMSACLPHAEQIVRVPDARLAAMPEAAISGVVTLFVQAGLFLWSQGEYHRARTFEERAVAHGTRWLGPEHPDTLSSLGNLAETLRAQGDLAGARAKQEQVLAACQRVLGPEHPDTLTSLNNLAATLRAQGDLAGARAKQEQVLAARQRVLGPEHPDTLGSLNNLAATLRAQGDLAGARAKQEQVLAACQRVLGPEHPDTLTSLNNLAATLSAQGDHAGARSMKERVLAAQQHVLGSEHPDTLRSLNNLAVTLFYLRDLAGAERYMQQAYESRRRVLGETHPDTERSRQSLETIRVKM